jgi:hypothetical protein
VDLSPRGGILSWHGSNGYTISTYACYALILMHAYPSAYAYQFDYACLCCYLIMPMVYDISEGKIYQDYAVWREGKWLVGILGIEVG